MGRIGARLAQPLDQGPDGPHGWRDVVAALDVVVGPDPTDLRSLPRPEASWIAALDDPKPPRRVAWSPTLGYAEVDAEVLAICERAVEAMASLGAEVVEVDTVFDEDPVGEWLDPDRRLQPAHARRASGGRPAWDGVDPVLATAHRGCGRRSRPWTWSGPRTPATPQPAAGRPVPRRPLLMTPTVAAVPPPRSLGGQGMINGTPDYNWVKFTYPFNMTRSPAATVCAGLSSSACPVGLQLVGPQHGDLVVLRSAAALEEASGSTRWHRCPCPLVRLSSIERARPTTGYHVHRLDRVAAVVHARAFSSVG